MSVTEVASASAPSALVISTPSTLSTETTAGVYQLIIDTNNLTGGDILVVRTKIKVVSGGTSRTFEEQVVSNVTATKAWATEPISIAWEVVYELEQTAGTGRIIPWSILRG